jgi:surface antigen
MQPGQYLAAPAINGSSPYQLVMQTDGNLVEYNSGGQPLWDSQTYGHPGAYAVLQASDGNLVVYPQTGRYLWSAFVPTSPGDRLCIQDDGNLVVYSASPANAPLWATMTTAGTGINAAWGERLSWNPGASGQCTWWAENEFHGWNVTGAYINTLGINGYSGNALSWWYNAEHRGWLVGTTPRIGAIAVFQPGTDGAGGFGHVAWVTQVYPSQNAIEITEMNYVGIGVVDSRRIAPAFGLQNGDLLYIYSNP